MSKYTIESSTLTSIAEAIRSKGGATAALKPVDMPEAIAAIQAGGGSGSNVGFTAYLEGTTDILFDENVTNIRDNAFYNSGGAVFKGVDFPNVIEVGENAFYQKGNLTSINLPKAQTIGFCAFYCVRDIKELILPEVVTVSSSAFCCSNGNVGKLTKVDLGSKTEYIGSSAFYYHSSLKTLIIRSNSVCALSNSNAFSSTPLKGSSATGYIYVPAALVEEYKVATNWSAYSGRFRAIEDYPDICGEVE